MTLRPEDSLGHQINHLARLFEHALRARIAPLGVVPGQFPALLALYAQDGLTQAELTRRVSIEQPTMANTLKRMERDGLITRTADSADARRARVHLTSHARTLEEPLTAAARDINAAAAQALEPDELVQLTRSIARLIAHLGHGSATTSS